MQAMCLVILCECFELSVGLPFAMAEQPMQDVWKMMFMQH